MSIQSIQKTAESFGYQISENGVYLDVNFALMVWTDKPPRYCQYAAFNDVGDIIAVGHETGGPGMGSIGGWDWIKDEFDCRVKRDVENPPEKELLKQLGIIQDRS